MGRAHRDRPRRPARRAVAGGARVPDHAEASNVSIGPGPRVGHRAVSATTDVRRLCVYAGSAAGSPSYVTATQELAEQLLRRGASTVYGGGAVGLMGVLADALRAGGGEVIGVIPRFLREREIGHLGLSELHVVETMHERKMLMADLADGFVVLPGGVGTLEEVVEMLSWSQLGLHRKPIGLLNVDGYWAPLLALLDHLADEGFIPTDPRDFLVTAPTSERLLALMDAWTAPEVTRWLRHGGQT